MRVTVKQKLLASPDVFRLSDLHLVWRDLALARDNFESSGSDGRTLSPERNLAYSLVASGLIHYRRAFDKNGHRRAFITDKAVRRCVPELYSLHCRLISLSNKHVAHSENQYEQCLVTVLVAEDDEGGATFRGLGMQATSIALLSENNTKLAAKPANELIEQHVVPKVQGLEEAIKKQCQSLSSNDLRNLPNGLAPPGSSNPQITRSWPHRGKY
jgi:hypothetical protein